MHTVATCPHAPAQRKDLSHISEQQLLADLRESEEDILICRFALSQGTVRYSGGASVQERLDANLKIVEIISFELAQRAVRAVAP